MSSVGSVRPAFVAPRREPAEADRSGAAPEPGAELRPRERVTLSLDPRERSVSGEPLDAAEQAEVKRLQETDAHVRAHERAHQAAGGGAAGAASFEYVVGPDGRLYATGGEVPIRVETGRTPDETIAAARRIHQAALAPTDPSAQDLAVAAEAVRMETRARAQQARQAASQVGAVRGASREVAAYERWAGAAGAAPGAVTSVRA